MGQLYSATGRLKAPRAAATGGGVPRGTWHWFDLCAERRIRAIRLFQDPAGWTPRYTDSGVAAGFEPVCLGPSHLPASP